MKIIHLKTELAYKKHKRESDFSIIYQKYYNEILYVVTKIVIKTEIAEEVEKEEVEKKERGHENLDSWVPQTKLGKMVKEGKIKNIDEILSNKMKILEPEIVDYLLSVDHDLLFVGQSKGKFGGGKRRAWRQSQKKTKEGNVITFSAFAVVGDKNGHVGIGFGKAKETLPAREKALRKAKLNLMKIKRGGHSVSVIPLSLHKKVFNELYIFFSKFVLR